MSTDGAVPAKDIPEALSRLLASRDRPALAFYRGKALEGRLTYEALAARIDGVAFHLHATLGIGAGDAVAILAPNRLEIPVLVLALLRLGAVVVPLNPAASSEDWQYILSHSHARGLFGTKDLVARADVSALAFSRAVEDLFDVVPEAPRAPPPPATSLAEAPAVALYTSGTTGRPKGVVLRQRSLLANGASMAKNFRMNGTTQLAVLPLYHAHAFGFGLMTALSSGGHLVFTDRLEPFAWAEVIRAERVEVTSVVPSLLPMLLAARVHADRVPTLRHIMVSSAPLAPDLARTFEEKTGIRLVQGWGLSEYTNFACCMPPFASDEEHRRLMFGGEIPSIGPALPGTEVRVLGDAGAVAGEGERGELAIRGPSTMLGYLDDAEATARTIDGEGWLRTGDEGYFRMETSTESTEPRPFFFVTGRLKEIIIRDAEKYSPLAIERRLVEALPELSGKVVVVGFSHRTHGEEVGAYVELAALDDALLSRFAAALAAMPVAERPKVVLYGDEPVPRTHTGKIQRRKMQPWFEAFADHRGALHVGPRQPATESTIR